MEKKTYHITAHSEHDLDLTCRLLGNAFISDYEIELGITQGWQLGDIEKRYEHQIRSDSFFSGAQLDQIKYRTSMCSANTIRLSATCTYLINAGSKVTLIKDHAMKIGRWLQSKMPANGSLTDAINLYQHWLNANFVYQDHNDFSAYTLLKDREGVCHSIAALTVLVFPYIGFPTQFIGGEALSGTSWQPHAWNTIWNKSASKWEHVDFTWGLHVRTPSTVVNSDVFYREHQWNEAFFSDKAFTQNITVQKDLAQSRIHLRNGSQKSRVGLLEITTPKPLMVKDSTGQKWIDICSLCLMLGGVAKTIPEANKATFSLGNRIVQTDADCRDDLPGFIPASGLLPFCIDPYETPQTFCFYLDRYPPM